MPADFSHLRKLGPAFLWRFHELGKTVADVEIAEALDQIDPPLLPPVAFAALMRIVRPTPGRPPASMPGRRQLPSYAPYGGMISRHRFWTFWYTGSINAKG